MVFLSKEAKVGIFVLAGIIVLAYFTLKVGRVHVSDQGYLLHASFENVSGLEKNAQVQMAGVPIGRVEKLSLSHGRAQAVLIIDKGVKIPVDSSVAVASEGFLGDKHVEIISGKDEEHFLSPGKEISYTVSGANIDDLIMKVTRIAEDVKKVTSALSEAFGGEKGERSLKDIVTNLREASASFHKIVTSNEEKFGTIIDRIDKLTSDLGEAVGGGKEDMKVVLANLREITESLKEETPKITEKLDSALGKIERGEGTLGKLLTDEEAYENLNSALEGVNRYIKKTEAIQTYLDYRMEFLSDPSDFKHYASLRIKPTEDKSYTFGVVDDPSGREKTTKNTVTTTQVTPPGSTSTVETVNTEFRDTLKFNFLIGRQFGDFAFRGGVMESTGGLGLSYFPLTDRISLNMDAFDFGRQANDPHLKIYGNYDIYKSFFVTAGYDDFLNNNSGMRTFFVGFGLRLRDDDLKTLLKSAPSVSP
jgi:phospholipid/cholesterol/gamma-HCH transport system substrate-binding protein